MAESVQFQITMLFDSELRIAAGALKALDETQSKEPRDYKAIVAAINTAFSACWCALHTINDYPNSHILVLDDKGKMRPAKNVTKRRGEQP